MKKFILSLLVLMSFNAFSDVNVRGYYRNDGTYVRPHTRSYPERDMADTYSAIYCPEGTLMGSAWIGSSEHPANNMFTCVSHKRSFFGGNMVTREVYVPNPNR